NHIQWGASYQTEIISDNISEWETRDSAGYSLPVNSEKVEIIYNLYSDVQLLSHRVQGYLQDTYMLEKERSLWVFTAGFRANYWSFNREFLLSPRATVAVFPDWKADINFRFSTGLYYQAPFYKEMRVEETDASGNNYVTLNSDIQAQRSLHTILGMDYYFRAWNRPFKLTVEAYYKPSDRVISYYVDNVRVRYSGENDAIAYSAGVDVKFFGEFVPGTDSWISFSWMRSRENLISDSYSLYSNAGNYLGEIYPGWISRPNEQRYNISFFFQDYFPNHPEYKVNVKLVWSDGLPFGPPHSERYQAVLRTKAYNRVDIGASRGFLAGREKFMDYISPVKNIWLSLEIFNLFDIQNVNSYYWVTDIYGGQYAVPNYLTGFMINFKASVGF
ncbi:MAG: TonB-dependent receptor, partial [bacterium]